MGSLSYAQAIKPDAGKLRKLIETSLKFDWIIRVEYASDNSGVSCWQQWDRTFFAIRAADAVLLAVADCYKNNPASTIRIYAEKVRPQTHLLYTVYQPRSLAADAAIKPALSQAPYQSKPVRASTCNSGDSLLI
jgi:ribulose bisphosphate carboxylase small subunit